ncbi:MAG: class I SAM-dependent methyltransferase [Anaerolineae bacterium]
MPEICDYEGSDYKQRFWTRDRRYEDLVERQALRTMLPPTGHAIADFGAGFGRLADLYAGYERVVLVDYSRTMLQQAREHYRDDPRFLFVATDIRKLPLATGSLDTIVTVRVLHHLRSVTQAVQEAARVLAPGGSYLLEFASKRHVKAIARYLLRRQSWSPFSREPVEFAELNLDFHPHHIAAELAQAGLTVDRRRALSLFRWQPLKDKLGPERLARVEAAVQPLASLYPLSPSVLLRARSADGTATRPEHLLACPNCHAPLTLNRNSAACTACRRAWPYAHGIYDFKGEGRTF